MNKLHFYRVSIYLISIYVWEKNLQKDSHSLPLDGIKALEYKKNAIKRIESPASWRIH